MTLLNTGLSNQDWRNRAMLKPPFLATRSIPLIIVRKTAGTYVNGRYVEGDATSFTIKANVQPGLKFNDTQYLAEGERGRLAVRVYTASEIRARKEGPEGYDADEFEYEGQTYVIRWCHHYKMGILDHWKAIAVAKEVT